VSERERERERERDRERKQKRAMLLQRSMRDMNGNTKSIACSNLLLYFSSLAFCGIKGHGFEFMIKNTAPEAGTCRIKGPESY